MKRFSKYLTALALTFSLLTSGCGIVARDVAVGFTRIPAGIRDSIKGHTLDCKEMAGDQIKTLRGDGTPIERIEAGVAFPLIVPFYLTQITGGSVVAAGNRVLGPIVNHITGDSMQETASLSKEAIREGEKIKRRVKGTLPTTMQMKERRFSPDSPYSSPESGYSGSGFSYP